MPISTPSIPLGTLWLYSRETRDFSDQQTNIIEIISGRIAAELEREVLLVEGEQAARSNRTLGRSPPAGRRTSCRTSCRRSMRSTWPAGPLRVETVSSGFYDWFPLADGSLALALGDALSSGVEGALLSAQVHGALRSQSQRRLTPAALLTRVNQTIWTTSIGDQSAALFYAVFDPTRRRLRYAMAGDLVALHIGSDGSEQIIAAAAPMGVDAETRFRQGQRNLGGGDILIVASSAVRDASDGEGCMLTGTGLAETVAAHLDESAEVLGELVRHRLLREFPEPAGDQTVLVFRHASSR